MSMKLPAFCPENETGAEPCLCKKRNGCKPFSAIFFVFSGNSRVHMNINVSPPRPGADGRDNPFFIKKIIAARGKKIFDTYYLLW